MKKDWTYKKFADLFNLNMGKTPARANEKYWTNGKYPWVAISDLSGGKFISHTKEQISQEAVDETNIHLVPKGTVIMSFKLSIGKTAITPFDLYTNEAIMAFEPKVGVDVLPDFLYYYLQYYPWSGNRAVMGETINKAVISNSYACIPPLVDQELIVRELDAIHGILEKKQEQLRELDLLAQAIFYDMFGDPITNPKQWEVKKLGEVAETTSGGTPSKAKNEYYDNGNIPWLRSGEVSQGLIYKTELFITQKGLDNSSAKIVPENTVSIAMYGATVGEVGIIMSPMCTNQAICNILPSNYFTPTYLRFFLMAMKPKYIAVAAGGAQPNISQAVIRNTNLSLPPLSLQQSFAAKIEAIEAQKTAIRQSIREVEALLAERMDAYFA